MKKVSVNRIKRLRYLLFSTVIFTAVVLIGLGATEVRMLSGNADQAYYTGIILVLCIILLPHFILIALTYTSPTYCGGRHATLLLGGKIFLFITIPYVVLFIYVIAGMHAEDKLPEFTMLYGLLYLLQWLVVLSVLIRYDIAGTLIVYRRVKAFISNKDAPENIDSDLLLAETRYERSEIKQESSISNNEHIIKHKYEQSTMPKKANGRVKKSPLARIRRVRHLLIGTAILSIVASITTMVLSQYVEGGTNISYSYLYSSLLPSILVNLIPFFVLIPLTYISPNGRWTRGIIFLGVVLFLFITIPYEALVFFNALTSVEENFYMLFMLVYPLQWLIIISTLIIYVIAAIIEGVTNQKGISEKTTIDQPLPDTGYEQKEVNDVRPALIRKVKWAVSSVLILAILGFWYAIHEAPAYHLFRAAMDGQTSTVVDLLDKGTDVNAEQSFPLKYRGWTALMWAALNGHLQTIDVLLIRGAIVDSRSSFNSTPLMAAASHGNVECVEILIKAGADVNAIENDGDSALSAASNAGNTKAIKLLLDANANVNIRNLTSLTPLIIASQHGRYETVQLLLKNDADPNMKEDDGYTALMYAASKNKPDIMRDLLNHGADINAKNNDGWTALMLSVQQGHADIVKALLEYDAYVDSQNKDGRTALMYSAYKHHTDITLDLLNYGADVNAKTSDGWTALMWAVGEGHEDTVKALLDNGADVNVQNEHGDTALIYAVLNNQAHIVKILLSAGANVNPGNEKGAKALIMAAGEGNIDIVELLLTAGAETNLKDSEGKTALMWAEKEGHHDIVYLLEQKEAKE